MASYYGRRNLLNLQLPGHYRLYPVNRDAEDQPVFDTQIGELPSRLRASGRSTAGATSNASNAGREEGAAGSTLQRAASRVSSSDEGGRRDVQPYSSPPSIPPPAYHHHGPGLPLVRTTSSGATLVSGVGSSRKSRVVKLDWEFHPSISGPHQKRDRLMRYLARKPEKFSDSFPDEFMELLLAGQCSENDINKIEELYKARVDHLNNWVIPEKLVSTRFWLALLEVSR